MMKLKTKTEEEMIREEAAALREMVRKAQRRCRVLRLSRQRTPADRSRRLVVQLS